jgi:radical SAM protein with 4Fe4S-binding SPASM domain
MTPETFGQLAASIAPMAHEVVLHLLGEPLTHPNLELILDAAQAVALPVNIVTNGLLLSGERFELVLRPIVRQISISLQSFANNFPHRDPRAYVSRIKQLTDRAQTERPDLYVNLRFWDLGPEELSQTYHNQGSQSDIRQVLSEVYGFSWDDVLIDIKRRRKGHRILGRIYLHFDSRFKWPDLKTPKISSRGRCHGLKKHFGIHADGTVVPCCLDHNADMALGNALKQPLHEILESSRAKAIRDGFAKGRLVEDLCQTCGYIQRFDRSVRMKSTELRFAAKSSETHEPTFQIAARKR